MPEPSPHAINDRIARFILGPGAISALPGQLEAVLAQATNQSLVEAGIGEGIEGVAGFRQDPATPWSLRRITSPYWTGEMIGSGSAHLSWDNRDQWGTLLPLPRQRGRWHGEHHYTYDYANQQQWMSLGAEFEDLKLGIDHGLERKNPQLYTVSGFAELQYGDSSLRVSTQVQRLAEDDIFSSEATLRLGLPGGLRGTLVAGQSNGPEGTSTTTEGTLALPLKLGNAKVSPFVTHGQQSGPTAAQWSEQGVRSRLRLGPARLGLGVNHRHEDNGLEEVDDWRIRGSARVPLGDGSVKGSIERGFDGRVQWMIRLEIPF